MSFIRESIIKEELSLINKKLDKILSRVNSSYRKVNTLNGETLYDNQDLTMMFHISPRTLQRYRKSGELTYREFGNKIYYTSEDVEQFSKIYSDLRNKDLRKIKR